MAGLPYDPGRLELFEILAEQLRSTGLPQPVSVTQTDVARRHFAFLESYFSNFIEGTEFDVQDARAFVPVSYTHLDVYKRQSFESILRNCMFLYWICIQYR